MIIERGYFYSRSIANKARVLRENAKNAWQSVKKVLKKKKKKMTKRQSARVNWNVCARRNGIALDVLRSKREREREV